LETVGPPLALRSSIVIGLPWDLLSAHTTLLAAEENVVVTRRVQRCSFSLMIEQPATQADRRALTQPAKVEERRQDETVSVGFHAPEDTNAAQTGVGSDGADQQHSARRGGAKLAGTDTQRR